MEKQEDYFYWQLDKLKELAKAKELGDTVRVEKIKDELISKANTLTQEQKYIL